MELKFPLILDGGMGTMLQAAGLAPGELPEVWNITHAQAVTAIHKAYLDAGAQVMTANTFGANRLKYPEGGEHSLREVISAGINCARNAITITPDLSRHSRGAPPQVATPLVATPLVAMDIGSTGKLLEPMGPLAFEDAVDIFREAAEIGAACGAELFFIETMTDLLELKAAVIACKEAAPEIPVFASFSVEENGRLLTGATAACAAMTMESLGVAAVGINCGAGPERALRVLSEILAVCGIPVLAQPNAGLPEICKGETLYNMTPNAFARQAVELYNAGASVLGGCCGTTPAHIAAICKILELDKNRQVNYFTQNKMAEPVICSASQIVSFKNAPVIIGERINPTGKPTFQAHLRAGNWDYILDEAAAQAAAGAQVLDVNLGLPGIDERAAMMEAVARIPLAAPLPLQIDSADPAVLEAALRRYQGKALVNSVNGKEESMRAVFPLLQKYGGAVVALLLDENGIPATVEGRLAIAKKIYRTAAEYGLGKGDILIDALTMAVGAGGNTCAEVTLETVARIQAMGGYTVLGVSNISFGLPQREIVNAAFFTMAMQQGLSAAIINPKSAAMMGAYHSVCLLKGKDPDAEKYIAFAGTIQAAQAVNQVAVKQRREGGVSPLVGAILQGREETARQIAQDALAERTPPMALIHGNIIPALDEVGKRFGTGELFLPQLLRSAAAAKAALEVLQEAMRQDGAEGAADEVRGEIVLATVHGDIHDIGKNIVKTLLETYRFGVVDLGKDVPPQEICDAVVEHHAALCGLSALMTTTLPAMEETISLLKQQAPWCKIMVGGAVLTEDYAKFIGADAYCKDAASGAAAAGKFIEV